MPLWFIMVISTENVASSITHFSPNITVHINRLYWIACYKTFWALSAVHFSQEVLISEQAGLHPYKNSSLGEMEILWTSPKLSPWAPTALTLYVFNVKIWKMPRSGTKKTEMLCYTFVLLSHIYYDSLTFFFSVGLHCRVSFLFHCDVWLDCGCVSLKNASIF